jgi:predicted lipoprotein with Yx(FWY)xxD motif
MKEDAADAMNQQAAGTPLLSIRSLRIAIVDPSADLEKDMLLRTAGALAGLLLLPLAVISCTDKEKEAVATSVSGVATSIASPVNSVATTVSGSASGATPTATRPAGTPSSTSSPTASATGTPAAGAATPAAGAATVLIADSSLGKILTDAKGMTLYTYNNDVANNGKSAVTGGLLQAWPALILASGTPSKPSGLSGDLTTITREDGSKQVAYKGLPLYTFQRDQKAGDVTGQNVAGFVVATP